MSIQKTQKKEQPRKRAEVFTKVYFDNQGNRHNKGEIVTITDEDELIALTECGAIKTQVI